MSNPYTPENSVATKSGGASIFGLHPLVAAAAASVIALSGVGIASMLMNRSSATPTPEQQLAAASTMSDTTSSAPAEPPVQAAPAPVYEAPISQPIAKPVSKPASKPVHKPTQIAAAQSQPSAPVYEAPIAQAPAPCRECAVIESTREIKVEGKGSGFGAIAGGLVGGLLGNRVGAGNGRALATVAGAVGGGYAGNSIEKSTKAGIEYEMVVRFEDGTTQKFTRANPWPYGSGDKVKVVDNQVVRG